MSHRGHLNSHFSVSPTADGSIDESLERLDASCHLSYCVCHCRKPWWLWPVYLRISACHSLANTRMSECGQGQLIVWWETPKMRIKTMNFLLSKWGLGLCYYLSWVQSLHLAIHKRELNYMYAYAMHNLQMRRMSSIQKYLPLWLQLQNWAHFQLSDEKKHGWKNKWNLAEAICRGTLL